MRLERRILAIAGILAFASLTAGSGMAVADDDDGGAPRVTSSGRITVPLGATSPALKLPLTQVGVAARCQHAVPPPELNLPSTALARAFVQAAPGETLDGLSPAAGGLAAQSLLTAPFATRQLGGTFGTPVGSTTAIVKSKRATATITMGATIAEGGDCTFLWQAIESRSS